VRCILLATRRQPFSTSPSGPSFLRRSIGGITRIVIFDGSGMRPGKSSTVIPNGGLSTGGTTFSRAIRLSERALAIRRPRPRNSPVSCPPSATTETHTSPRHALSPANVATTRRRNRTFQAGDRPALPVLKTVGAPGGVWALCWRFDGVRVVARLLLRSGLVLGVLGGSYARAGIGWLAGSGGLFFGEGSGDSFAFRAALAGTQVVSQCVSQGRVRTRASSFSAVCVQASKAACTGP
jgi:hypothetical protein